MGSHHVYEGIYCMSYTSRYQTARGVTYGC